ncbi:hypothetical protein [Xanthomonas euvesicatoria]|uniref:hypothetical protein n=1 Tax=Xanthomonas euvesicatoria TaxID=456327 RepID=UPI000F8ED14F|nr:hypothetical protein [Xanthomonas euvesicatoria]MBV6785886.1 hypothetical protein [Xanthomonas campestris pv. uppalii]MBV6797633.1 hypothetical protein [Xanthomonas campestris pv. obscurae]MCP3048882.1 hypothetical protein [Xanthomonas euvesicatoria pv. allii]
MKFDESDGMALIKAINEQGSDYIVCHGVQTIYGTGSAQKVYLRVQEFLTTRKRSEWKSKNLVAHVGKKHIEKEKYKEISNYWLSVKNQYVKNDALPESSDDDVLKKNFWGEFDSLYKQRSKDPRTLPTMLKGPEIMGPGETDFVARDNEALIDDIIVRRSCKFLLYDSIKRKQDIAYVLDDLDLDTVAQRITVSERTDRLGEGTTERKVPVCTSELREIFRRWDYFVGYLTFYKAWKVSDPPWYTHGRQNWAMYAAHLAAKIVAKHPAEQHLVQKRLEVDQAIQAGEPLQAIHRFHEMNPSRFLPGAFVNLVVAN